MITVLVTNQTTSKATVIGLLTATFRKHLKSLEVVISPELPLPIKTHLPVSQSSLKVNTFDEKSCDLIFLCRFGYWLHISFKCINNITNGNNSNKRNYSCVWSNWNRRVSRKWCFQVGHFPCFNTLFLITTVSMGF